MSSNSPRSASSHLQLEKRSIALHRAIAEKLKANPKLLAVASDNLSRWMKEGSRAMPYFKEWEEILSRPLEEILKLITSDCKKMTILRQSSPFCGILDPKERWKIYESFSA